MKNEELRYLKQLVKGLEDSHKKLLHYFALRDIENLNKTKRLILSIQKKINEVLR